jgi:hypothetical protein
MSQPTFDLSDLFGAALQAVTAHRQEINALDGYNGNHGDNMVENVRMIVDAVKEKGSRPPAEALEYAGQRLQSQGRGGTSQYYARGLGQAAEQLQGRSNLDPSDVTSLVQSLLGAIPSQGHPQQPQAGGSVLEQVLGMVGSQPGQTEPQQQAQVGGSVLEQIMGLAGGQPPQAEPQDGGLDVDDVLSALLPAGLAFLQAKQAGADTASAAAQALTGALMGGRVNPLQAGTPRAAAGGLIAQSILKALAGGG